MCILGESMHKHAFILREVLFPTYNSLKVEQKYAEGGAMDVAKREKYVRQKKYIKHKDPQIFLHLDKCKFVCGGCCLKITLI